ncbi:hypothetical protein [Burkholderia cenocepacia]|uniref:hypothetical protein n=1 Tax=Burkholderia cenocepacia TaxID=95486 RepID=UPI001589744A|nr:hypothetical protein [Burkholderia cenocepacia]
MKNGRYEEDDSIRYYFNNILHRENGPAIEFYDGQKSWLLNGLRHRENGPALEGLNGSAMWFLNNLLHREDGPAWDCKNDNGSWEKRWFLNGQELTKEEYGHFLEKKALKEKLESKLAEKGSTSRGKI